MLICAGTPMKATRTVPSARQMPALTFTATITGTAGSAQIAPRRAASQLQVIPNRLWVTA